MRKARTEFRYTLHSSPCLFLQNLNPRACGGITLGKEATRRPTSSPLRLHYNFLLRGKLKNRKPREFTTTVSSLVLKCLASRRVFPKPTVSTPQAPPFANTTLSLSLGCLPIFPRRVASQRSRLQLTNTTLCECQVVQRGVGTTITRRQTSDVDQMDVGCTRGRIRCWVFASFSPVFAF